MSASAPDQVTANASPSGHPRRPVRVVRGRLFRKYVAAVAGIVVVALLTNGAMEAWATWRDH